MTGGRAAAGGSADAATAESGAERRRRAEGAQGIRAVQGLEAEQDAEAGLGAEADQRAGPRPTTSGLGQARWARYLTVAVLSLTLIARVGLWEFLSGTRWSPTSTPPQFGILPMIVGSLWVTVGALLTGWKKNCHGPRSAAPGWADEVPAVRHRAGDLRHRGRAGDPGRTFCRRRAVRAGAARRRAPGRACRTSGDDPGRAVRARPRAA